MLLLLTRLETRFGVAASGLHRVVARCHPRGSRRRLRSHAHEAPPYKIESAPEIEDHFEWLKTRDIAIVLDTVERQLSYEPTVRTRNGKPLDAKPLAPWELRIGKLRVELDVADKRHAS